jgi:hypothetical protein
MAHGNRSPSPSDPLGADVSPVTDPLSYPGALPDGPVLLCGGRFVDLDPVAVDVEGRHPVLAVGSNAGRARLAEKLAVLPGAQEVPVMPCRVDGAAVAFTALVASYGSIPYTAVPGEGLACRTFLQYLDDAQLAVIDASEQPGYRRDLLTGLRVALPSGDVLGEAWAYVCEQGAIADGGALVALRPQADAYRLLAAWFPDLVPPDPVEAVGLMVAEPGRRRAVADALERTGRVRPLPPAC